MTFESLTFAVGVIVGIVVVLVLIFDPAEPPRN